MNNDEITVYISGAMTNSNDYERTFALYEKELKEAGYQVVNPVRVAKRLVFEKGKNLSYKDYLINDLNVLANECNAICMIDGWENSKGSKAEKSLADALRYREIKIFVAKR